MEGLRKIIVTGARGFVGKHLSKRLTENENIKVILCDDRGVALDVTNFNQVNSVGHADALINLAGKTSIKDSFSNPHSTYWINVVGALNLLELARTKNIKRFIHVSTYVYGQPEYLPVDENHPINPHGPYFKSKLLADRLCESYSSDFGMNVVVLRPFYLYGAGSRPYAFVPSIVRQIQENSGLVTLSGRRTTRDFLFIDDFIDLVVLILKRFPSSYNLYNVGYGMSTSLEDVVSVIGRMMNKIVTISYDQSIRYNEVTYMVADISKVSKEFGWKPIVNLETGIKRAVDALNQ